MRMPSRDSGVWAFGMIAGIIVAVSANVELFPWLSDDVKHHLNLAAFIISVTSAKMANSPQPSKARQKEDARLDDAVKAIRRRKRKP
jgi:hypothetical protein